MDVNSIFMDSGERQTAVVGEGYLYRFLKENTLRCGFCVLTDRRIYCKGTYFHKTGRAYRASKGDYTLEIKDVTASGYATTRFGIVFLLELLFVVVLTVLTGLFLLLVDAIEHYHFRMEDIIWGCTVLLVVGLVAAPIYYYVRPFRIFVIEYVSGKIAFLAFDYLEEDIRVFQRELYRIKDASVSAEPAASEPDNPENPREV